MGKLVVVFLCFLVGGCVSGPDYFATEMRYDYSLKTYTADDLSDPIKRVEAAFLYTLLANTKELRIHQMNGATDNEVYVKKERINQGYPEVVVRYSHDEKGEKIEGSGVIVRDCENMGSFNYKHPQQEPLGHFAQDRLPWIRWGNCPEDTTTREQRVAAYMWDVREGLEGLVFDRSGYYLPVGFDFSENGQSETVAFFLAALSSSDFDLYDFVMNHTESDIERVNFYMSLEKGINSMLLANP